MDDLKYDFFLSLLDVGTRHQPSRNLMRLLSKKPFAKPEMAAAMQVEPLMSLT